MPSPRPLLRTNSGPLTSRSVSMKTDTPAALERSSSLKRTFTSRLLSTVRRREPVDVGQRRAGVRRVVDGVVLRVCRRGGQAGDQERGDGGQADPSAHVPSVAPGTAPCVTHFRWWDAARWHDGGMTGAVHRGVRRAPNGRGGSVDPHVHRVHRAAPTRRSSRTPPRRPRPPRHRNPLPRPPPRAGSRCGSRSPATSTSRVSWPSGCATPARRWRLRRRRSLPPTWPSSTSRRRWAPAANPSPGSASRSRRAARPSPRCPRRGSTWPAWPTTTPSTTVAPGCPARCEPPGRSATPIPHSRSSASVATRRRRSRLPSPRSTTRPSPRWPRRSPTRTPPRIRPARGRPSAPGRGSPTRRTRPASSRRCAGQAAWPTWSWSTSTGASRARAAPRPTSAASRRRLVAAGADVVVGTHAHQLQGDGRLGPGYVAYGLGNYAWYAPGTGATSRTGVLTLTVRPPVERRGRARVVRAVWQPAVIGSSGLAMPVAAGVADGLPRTPAGPARLCRPRAAEPGQPGCPRRGQPLEHDPADPLELGGLDDLRDVRRASGSRRTASTPAGRPADRRERTTSGRCCAGRGRPRPASPATGRPRAGCAARDRWLRPTRRAPRRPPRPGPGRPCPGRPAAGGRQVLDVGPRPVVVVGVARSPGLLGAERHEHDREPGPVARRRLGRGEHDADARRVVLGSWCRRHGVEVGADDEVRLLGREAGRPRDHVDRPARRDRHAPRAPGRYVDALAPDAVAEQVEPARHPAGSTVVRRTGRLARPDDAREVAHGLSRPCCGRGRRG